MRKPKAHPRPRLTLPSSPSFRGAAKPQTTVRRRCTCETATALLVRRRDIYRNAQKELNRNTAAKGGDRHKETGRCHEASPPNSRAPTHAGDLWRTALRPRLCTAHVLLVRMPLSGPYHHRLPHGPKAPYRNRGPSCPLGPLPSYPRPAGAPGGTNEAHSLTQLQGLWGLQRGAAMWGRREPNCLGRISGPSEAALTVAAVEVVVAPGTVR